MEGRVLPADGFDDVGVRIDPRSVGVVVEFMVNAVVGFGEWPHRQFIGSSVHSFGSQRERKSEQEVLDLDNGCQERRNVRKVQENREVWRLTVLRQQMHIEAEHMRQGLRRKPPPTAFTADVSGLRGAPIVNVERCFCCN